MSAKTATVAAPAKPVVAAPAPAAALPKKPTVVKTPASAAKPAAAPVAAPATKTPVAKPATPAPAPEPVKPVEVAPIVEVAAAPAEVVAAEPAKKTRAPKAVAADGAEPAAPKKARAPKATTDAAPAAEVAPSVVAVTAAQQKHLRIATIPESRVRRYLDGFCINPGVNKLLSENHEKLAPYARAEKALADKREEQVDAAGKPVLDADRKPTYVALSDAKTAELKKFLADNAAALAELNAEAEALKNIRTRFSEGAARLFRDISVEVARELIEHAFAQCAAADKKIVNIQHMRATGVEKLSTYPLFSRLPSWLSSLEAVEAAPATEAAEPAAVEESPDDDVDLRSRGFIYYLTEMCSEMIQPFKRDAAGEIINEEVERKDPKTGNVSKISRGARDKTGPYAAFRTSKLLKENLSSLLFELADRLSPLVQRQLGLLRIKTVGEEHIMSVVSMLVVDGSPASETLTRVTRKVPEPDALAKIKEERAKARAEKREPTDKRTDAELPQVEVLEYVKTLNFADDRLDRLNAALKEHREQHSAREAKLAAAKDKPVV